MTIVLQNLLTEILLYTPAFIGVPYFNGRNWNYSIFIHDGDILSHKFSIIFKLMILRKYSSSTNDNDIAIMVVESPFQYTNYVRPACLPQSNFKISNGANVIISGWGATETGHS